MATLEATQETEETLPPDYFGGAANKLQWQRPIPGQGLLSDPEKPLPFERPPEFTSFDKAKDHLFNTLLDMSTEVADLLEDGLPVEELTNLILRSGYQQGKWSVDLMLLLIEPTVYFLLFICEVAGVDYVLSSDEDEEFMEPESKMKMENHLESLIKKKTQAVEGISEEGIEEKSSQLIPGDLKAEVAQRVGGSLLAKPEETTNA